MSAELKRIESLFKRSLEYQSKNEWNLGVNFEKDLEYELSLERKILENDARQFEEELIKNPMEEEVKRETSQNKILFKLFTSKFDSLPTINKLEKNIHYSSGNSYSICRKSDIINKIYLTVKSSSNIQDILNSSFCIESNGDCIFPNTKIFTLLLTSMFYDINVIYDEEKDEYQIPLVDFTLMANDKNLFSGYPIFLVPYTCLTIIIENDDMTKLDINVYQEGQILDCNIRNNLAKTEVLNYFFPRNNLIRSYRCSYSQDCFIVDIDRDCLSKFLIITFNNIDILPIITNAFIEGEEYVEWEEDDILTVDMLDKKFYILPLTKEFSSWENILNSFKDPHEKILKTPFYSYNISKLILYTNMEISNVLIQVYSYNFKLMKVQGGTNYYQYS